MIASLGWPGAKPPADPLVYYVAGRKAGQDKTSYIIQGRTKIRINLEIDVT